MRLTAVLSLLCALVLTPVLTAQDRGHRRSQGGRPDIQRLLSILKGDRGSSHTDHATIEKNIEIFVVGESGDGKHGSHGKAKSCNCDCHSKGCPKVSTSGRAGQRKGERSSSSDHRQKAHGKSRGKPSFGRGRSAQRGSKIQDIAKRFMSGKGRGKPSDGRGRGARSSGNRSDIAKRLMSGNGGEKIREMIRKRMGDRGERSHRDDRDERGRKDAPRSFNRNKGQDSDRRSRGQKKNNDSEKKSGRSSSRRRSSKNSDSKSSPMEGIARQFMSGNPEDRKRMMDMAQQFMGGGKGGDGADNPMMNMAEQFLSGDPEKNKAMMDMARQFLGGEQGKGLRDMIKEQAGPEAGEMIEQLLESQGKNEEKDEEEIHLEWDKRSGLRRSREVNLENENRESRLNEIDDMVGDIHQQMKEIQELLESLRNDG